MIGNLKMIDLISDFIESYESASNLQGLNVYNPENLQIIKTLICDSPKKINQKIEEAQGVQCFWASSSNEYRQDKLKSWSSLCERHKSDLASLLSLEQGKPLSESLIEIDASIKNIKWAADCLDEEYSYETSSHVDKATNVIKYEPIGIVAAITPWNFPSAMITRKVAPALAAGCVVLAKPAEDTPLSALALLALAREAGIDEGIFDVVLLSREGAGVFSKLCFENPNVRLLSFTGSTAVGKTLITESAQNVTKLSLELGGDAPFIVTERANLDKAIDAAFASKFRNAGQTCICANRIYIHEHVYERFKKGFVRRVAQARIGGAFDNEVEIGPLINEQALNRLRKIEEELKGQSISPIYIDFEQEYPDGSSGYFFKPAIYEVSHKCSLINQEIFGPIAFLCRYSDTDDIAALANDTPYGLAAYIYDQNSGEAKALADQLHFGMVGINEIRIADASIPFGGAKHSGIGREGGQDALKYFMNMKYICHA